MGSEMCIRDSGISNEMVIYHLDSLESHSDFRNLRGFNDQNFDFELDGFGNTTILETSHENFEGILCLFDSIQLERNQFFCNDTGTNEFSFYVFDSGKVDTASYFVTVADNLLPNYPQTLDTVYLDENGNYDGNESDFQQFEDKALDNCGVFNAYISPNDFDCSHIGTIQSVEINIIDVNDNDAEIPLDIIVLDTFAPIPQCLPSNRAIPCHVDSSGMCTLTTAQVDKGTFDVCGGVDTIYLSRSTLDCNTLGRSTKIWLIAVDIYGNKDSCETNINLIDNIAPSSECPDLNFYLNDLGEFHIGFFEERDLIDSISEDNCGSTSGYLSQNSFNCNDLGANSVAITIRDQSRNEIICNSDIIIHDTIPPTAICRDTLLYLNSSGIANLIASDLDIGSIDNCCIDSLYLSKHSFTCDDIGSSEVMFFALDKSGNIDSCTVIVNTLDTLHPDIVVQNMEIYLDDNGNYLFTELDSNIITSMLSDNCIANINNISQTSFSCMDTPSATIEVQAIDNSSNVSTAFIEVTILDTLSPIITCPRDTLYLNMDGISELEVSDLDLTITRACSIDSLYLSKGLFHCTDLGENTVTVTVIDDFSNTESCELDLVVLDTITPILSCAVMSVYLDDVGLYSFNDIDSSLLISYANDNCSVQINSISKQSFSCTDKPQVEVAIDYIDDAGNSSLCNINVEILDTISPTLNCQDITLYLNNSGNYSLGQSDSTNIQSFASDNCSINQINISQVDFSCDDVPDVELEVQYYDSYGNMSLCIFTAHILDTLSPSLSCADMSIYLDNNGTYNLSTSDSMAILSSVSGSCEYEISSISQSLFSCDHVPESNVTIEFRDISGSTVTCDISVQVFDTIAPEITSSQSVHFFNELGDILLSLQDLNFETTDNCALDSVWISSSEINCHLATDVEILLYASDTNDNIDSIMLDLIFIDTIAPSILCSDTTFDIGDFQNFKLTDLDILDLIMVEDNCLLDTVLLSSDILSCGQQGINEVLVTASDNSSNQNQCIVSIFLTDIHGYCCPDSLEIPQNISLDDSYYSNLNTMASGTVISMDSVNLFSQSTINLLPNFVVEQGGILLIDHEDCLNIDD